MKKLAIFSLLALLVLGIVATTVFAFQNQEMKNGMNSESYDEYLEAFDERKLTEEEFNEKQELRAGREERREAMQDAIESEDYETWNELVEEMEQERIRMSELITEENFDKFVEMHQARSSGDFETAQEIAEELGIGRMQGMHSQGMGRGNNGRGMGQGMKGKRNGDCQFR